MRRRHEGGFTLVELMVVVAIVIALGAVAIMSIRSTTYGGGPLGFARQIVSELEDMRARAISQRRWQRLVIDERLVVHQETIATKSMAIPPVGDWRDVRTLMPAQQVVICGVEAVPRVQPLGSGCQGSVPFTITFAPDGTVRDSATGAYGTAATIYVTTEEANASVQSATQEYRVTMYRATGLALLFEGF
jgi:Tfp pilus assembly protein FimT